MTTKIILTECPACGARHDRTTSVNCSNGPKPGDITVCFKCGCICEFNHDLFLVLAKNTSAPNMADAKKVQQAVRALQGLPI